MCCLVQTLDTKLNLISFQGKKKYRLTKTTSFFQWLLLAASIAVVLANETPEPVKVEPVKVEPVKLEPVTLIPIVTEKPEVLIPIVTEKHVVLNGNIHDWHGTVQNGNFNP